MKNLLLLSTAVFILSCTPDKNYIISIENNSDFDRKDVGITISRSELEHLSTFDPDLLPVLTKGDNTYIPSQIDDLESDGSWDEMFIMTNLAAGESLKALLSFIPPEKYPVFEARTNIRFARKGEVYEEVKKAIRELHAINTETQKVWQMEGIAWENDKIGFRNYFDRRNGMDIFGKVTKEMVLDSVGYKEDLTYHEFNPEWGVDVLKVGNSLGAGSIAIWYNDSLFRVGDNGTGTCEVLIEGPLRSIFRFEFNDWKMGDQTLKLVHDVGIQAGKYYFENDVSVSGTDANIDLVSGIVNKKCNMLHVMDSVKGVRAFFTHDLQSEDTSMLGMGIMLAEKQFSGTSEAPLLGDGITETYCIHLDINKKTSATFRVYSVWERENDRWKTAEGFGQFLFEEAELMEFPVSVKFSRR